jgi:hypothetical protein
VPEIESENFGTSSDQTTWLKSPSKRLNVL